MNWEPSLGKNAGMLSPYAFLVWILIPELGADEFDRRQQAHAAIESLMPAGLAFVHQAAAENGDVEIRRRCERIAARQHDRYVLSLLPAECKGQWPWIDSAPQWREFGEAWERSAYRFLEMARAYSPYGTWDNGWPDYREATRLFVEEMVAEGKTEAAIRSLLAKMHAGDLEQLKRVGR